MSMGKVMASKSEVGKRMGLRPHVVFPCSFFNLVNTKDVTAPETIQLTEVLDGITAVSAQNVLTGR